MTFFHHSSPYPPTKYWISISPDISPSPPELDPPVSSSDEHPARAPAKNKAPANGINHFFLNTFNPHTPFLIYLCFAIDKKHHYLTWEAYFRSNVYDWVPLKLLL